MRSPDQTGSATPHPLPGRYRARVQDIDCELELNLDHMGCLTGLFSAEGEALRVVGGVPSGAGEVYGSIREGEGDGTLAVFRAVPQVSRLLLEFDAPEASDRWQPGERIVFERLALA